MLGTISDFGALLGQTAAETTTSPFYQQGWFKFLVLIGVIAFLWYLANLIAKQIRMVDYAGRLAIIFISFACAILVILSGWWENPDRPGPKLGVDLRGGVNIIGQLNLEALDDPDAPIGAEQITAQAIIPNLLRRVDPSGTKEIMIRALGTDKIEVTIPDVDLNEADEIWYRLAKTGHLQFRIAADTRFHLPIITLASDLALKGDTSRTVMRDGKVMARWYNLARVDRDGQEDPDDIIPIKFVPSSANYLVRDKRTGQLIDMMTFQLGNDQDAQGRRFAEQLAARGIDTPQMLMVEPETERSDVQGKHLTGIRSSRDETGRPSVNFDLNSDGARRMSYLTTLHKPKGEGSEYLLGIVLDNTIHSAPAIQTPIHGSGRITGSFTQSEINDLIINLRSGKIDVALNKNPISKQYIESSLGKELRDKGFLAIGASFLLVLVFMIFYYRFAGIVASIALLLNLAFILALIMAIRQPLTLTGLAGLVLTVGMSVDANVLIFERIREELNRGAALRMAIRNGFDKATVTIVDANVTTLITALVLYVIGTEQIKGFAVTLILGILMSMFTAIYCSRTVFEIAERKRWINKLSMLQILGKRSFDFLSKRAITIAMSCVLIVAGIVGIVSLGSKILDHDLRGGSTAQVVFNQTMDEDAIEDTLNNLGLEHNNEEIEFTVTKMRNPNLENVFKIDSNLPSYDGNDSSEAWKQLDEILAEQFEGKLRLHHVDITSSATPSVSPDNQSGQINRKVTPDFWNLTAPALIHNFQIGPMTMLQDPTTDPGQQEEAKKEETKKEAESNTGEQQTGGDSTSADPDLGGADQDPPENTQTGDGALPQLPAGDNGSDVDETPKSFDVETVTVNLKFANMISGKAITTLLVQSASRLNDKDIEESQITVTPAVLDEDTNAALTLSKDWTVKLQVADADSILNSWSSEFNAKPYFPVTGGVGGQIAKETQYQALAAVIASLLGIIAYVWIRFQNVAFGLAAVVALIHDVLIVLGAIALSHYVAGALGFILMDDFKISLPVVAALLTIIGYSLNDTIVVFDRIREVRGKRSELNEEMINSSISQTLSRTILTSLTTFIVVFILYVFGGDAIHGFAFALTVGVIVGTYSSIFVASPALLWLMNRGLSPVYDDDGTLAKKPA